MAIMDQIKRLATEQSRAWETEGKPLADIAETREFTAEEAQKFERLNEAFNSFDDRITALRHQMEVEERQFESLAGPQAVAPVDHSAQIRSLLRGEVRSFDITPTAAEVRALNITTATAGGNLVPKTFLGVLIESLRQFSGVMAAGAYQLITGSGEEITIPRLSSFGAAAAQTEATQLTGTDPAFDQVKLNAYKYGDWRAVSTELIQDSIVDIEGIVTRLIGENIAVLLGTKLAIGAGTTEPTGVVVGATIGKTGATAVSGVPAWDDLIDLQESVLAPYQARASWVMSNGAVGAIRKIKDSSNRYLWEPNGQAGQPSTLLGAPVFRDPFMAAPAINALSVAYGDFSRYWVRTVGAVRIERSDHALFGADQVAFRGVLRADGKLVDTAAVKTFKGGAS